MFKRTLTTLAAVALVSAATLAQASSTFPSAAVEGSEQAFRAVAASSLSSGSTTMAIIVPSAGVEGSETSTRHVAAPRNLERSYAGSATSIFPDSSME